MADARARSPQLDAILGTPPRQMSYGEHLAVEGMLSQLRPTLSIEIGTAQGGSLRRIAAYSEHVHSFDLVEPEPEVASLPNVTLHTGDGHVLLPQLLEQLEREGRRVDFAFVDGDNSASGVRRDVEDLLASDAVVRAVLVLHDTMNDEVRRGLDAVDWEGTGKVRYVDLDLVPGSLFVSPWPDELRGGLGLVVVDAAGDGPIVRPTHARSTHEVLRRERHGSHQLQQLLRTPADRPGLERAALAGVLATRRPARVLALDPRPEDRELASRFAEHVEDAEPDSLAAVLERLVADDRRVDVVLVGAGHRAAAREVVDRLAGSPAGREALIILDGPDPLPGVETQEAVRVIGTPFSAAGPGFGMVALGPGDDAPTRVAGAAPASGVHDPELTEALRRAQAAVAALQASPSWRATAPLRAVKGALRRRLR